MRFGTLKCAGKGIIGEKLKFLLESADNDLAESTGECSRVTTCMTFCRALGELADEDLTGTEGKASSLGNLSRARLDLTGFSGEESIRSNKYGLYLKSLSDGWFGQVAIPDGKGSTLSI